MALAKSKPSKEMVVSKALHMVQEELHLSGNKVAQIIGVSASTFSRIKTTGLDPDKKSGELALLLIRVYRALFTLFGGNQAQMRHWLATPNHALQGVPKQLLVSVTGLTAVVHYLDAMRGAA